MTDHELAAQLRKLFETDDNEEVSQLVQQLKAESDESGHENE